MTFNLTESEMTLLDLLLKHCKTKDDELPIDTLADKYFHERVRQGIRSEEKNAKLNVKQRMRMLVMKMAAKGAPIERKSRLGVGSPATYGFTTYHSIVRAKKIHEKQILEDAA